MGGSQMYGDQLPEEPERLPVRCQCGRFYQVPITWAGRRGRCKACGGVFHVPELPPDHPFRLQETAIIEDRPAPSPDRPEPAARSYDDGEGEAGGDEGWQVDEDEEEVDAAPPPPPPRRATSGPFAWLTDRSRAAASRAGFMLFLLGRAASWVPTAAFTKRREIFRQMYICGVESLPVVVVVALFTGMILSLQAGITLSQFGQEELVATLVAVSMCREMGPFMTGLICAANVGSSMAAEMGTMKVSEEIDALEVMSIDPARFLVMPRLLGMTLMCPILTILTNFIGTVGGMVIAYFQLDVDWVLYANRAVSSLELKDIYTGLAKATVFGLVIALVGCAQGLKAKRGALGVGQATRSSVIISFLMIIILGFFMTSIFYST